MTVVLAPPPGVPSTGKPTSKDAHTGPRRSLLKPLSLREALRLANKHGVRTRPQRGGHILFYLPDRPVAAKRGHGTEDVHRDIVKHLNSLERGTP